MTPTHDDGFHEIQLNGKQVVFLFMAATVVSVVIFLCGVLVGRGVRADRPLLVDTGPASAVAETTPPPQPQPAPSTPAGSDPRAAPPPPGVDDLSYFNRLETKTQPREQLKPVAESASAGRTGVEKTSGEKPGAERATLEKVNAAKANTERANAERANTERANIEKANVEKANIAKKAAAKAEPEKLVAVKPAVVKPAPAPAAADKGAPDKLVPDKIISAPEDVFAVQIAALNVRGEAEAIAKRLTAKGYAAYVLGPSDGTPSVYRVRIGRFPTRHEAETVAAKLKKEEQFNPWVTR